MYFLVKRPGWLTFDPTEYGGEDVKTLQVRHQASKSNTRLVKFRDGSWYLKNGRKLFPLKSIDLKRQLSIGSKKGDTVSVDEITAKKWFIKSENLRDFGTPLT